VVDFGVSVLQMADAGKGRGSNRGPNEEARRVANEHNLNKAGQQELHRRISRKGLNLEEMAEEAAEIANHPKWVKPKP
jgi:hypothetical protein